MDVREVAQLADAVVLAWYAGQEGGYALADLLFGDANFSGSLPVTFPADGDKLPDFEDYSMQHRTYKYMTDNIFYPFGYGLHYGRLQYQNLQVKADKKQGAHLTLTISNPTNREITEVVQAYVSAPGAGTTAPLQQLAAFQRLSLAPGASREVVFDIAPQQLMTVGNDGESRLTRGEYTFTVGNAAPSPRSQELGVNALTAKAKL
jgi:beta-glucosidase